MSNFKFIFFRNFLHAVFSIAEKLCIYLQSSSVDVCQALQMSEITTSELYPFKKENMSFSELYNLSLEICTENEFNLANTSKPNKRRHGNDSNLYNNKNN